MVPTAQAVARQFQLTFGCNHLQECEYFCSRLQSTLQFALLQRPVSDIRAPSFAGVFEDGSEQKGHEERSLVQCFYQGLWVRSQWLHNNIKWFCFVVLVWVTHPVFLSRFLCA
jgi:hypothetical protein